MKKTKTRWAMILDRSGSMAGTRDAAISGLNEQIQQVREIAKEQDIRCSFVTFNGTVYEHLWDVPVEQLVEAKPEDFVPNGSTAMRDAMGYTVHKLLSTADEFDDDTAYLINIISDGQDNVIDQHYSDAELHEMIQSCQATKRWTFNHMGCSPQYMHQIARTTGIPIANMAAWSNATDGSTTRGFQNQNVRMIKYFSERSAGQLCANNFASDELGAVAMYDSPVKCAVAKPVIQDAVHVDFNDLLAKNAKYQATQIAGTAGPVGLFGASNAVKWQS